MPLDPLVAKSLAATARRQALQKQVERHRGHVDGTAALARVIAEQNLAARDKHDAAKAALEAHDAGEDPVLDRFDYRSELEDALRAERQAGKAALVTYVKAHPTCPLEAAVEAWLGALPGEPLQDVDALLTYYRAQLVRHGILSEASWAVHRAWIAGSPFELAGG